MALIVKLFINETEIAEYYAVRHCGEPHELCTYVLDDDTTIEHHYDDGAEVLAAKILLHQLTAKKGAGRGRHSTCSQERG